MSDNKADSMELDFDVYSQLYTQQKLRWISARTNPELESVVNRLGAQSAKARGLSRPITTFNRLVDSDQEQSMFIVWLRGKDASHVDAECPSLIVAEEERRAIGFFRTARKRLYLRDSKGAELIVDSLCLIDGFIHASLQHRGIGLKLFTFVMEHEKTSAALIAYDNPTSAFLGFLAKHFGLEQPLWQSTNLVVFAKIFTAHNSKQDKQMDAQQQSATSIVQEPSATSLREGVEALIHDNSRPSTRQTFDANTPRGRKYARDYCHHADTF